MSSVIPCSASKSLATLRISAWGVGDAATLMVVPARSLPASAVEAASEEAEAAADSETEAVEPQAARLRARAPARAAEINFFIQNISSVCVWLVVCFRTGRSLNLPSHSYTGLFVHRTTFHDKFPPYRLEANHN